MREEPLFRKCCRCVPLRLCLQVWAWVKIVADLIISIILIAGLVLFYFTKEFHSLTRLRHEHLFLVIVIALIVDFCFLIVLVIGVCKKTYSTLRIFFYYSIYMIVVETTIMSVLLFFALCTSPPRRWDSLAMCYIIFVLAALFWILVDISIILTLKSEMMKIRNKEQYDFSRIQPFKKSEEDNDRQIILEGRTEKYANEEQKYLKFHD